MKRYKLLRPGYGFIGKYAARMQSQNTVLQKENAQLRKALEFYAKPANYEPWREEDEDRTDAFNFVDLDGGQTAREALSNGEESNAL